MISISDSRGQIIHVVKTPDWPHRIKVPKGKVLFKRSLKKSKKSDILNNWV